MAGYIISPSRHYPEPTRSSQSLVRRIDPFTLRLFLTAVEEGQLSRAAERENIVPSAATRRIQELEELTGIRLLERNAKGVTPSPAGQVVARHAKSVLDALDGMRCELAALQGADAAFLSIAGTRPLIVYFLAAEIGEFSRQFPLTEVELREETYAGTLSALATGEVELAVFDTRSNESEIECVESAECLRERLVALIPRDHPLSGLSSICLEVLLDQEDLIGTRRGSCLMANLAHASASIGRDLRLKRSVETLEAARSLVSAGLGIALQPASGIVPPHERERVIAVPIDGDWATLSYRVGWRAGKPLSAAGLALREQLVARMHCVTSTWKIASGGG
jgi:DNA-binding transcriptional LysR family regulator